MFRRFRKDTKGSVIVFVALTIPVALGVGAFSLDLGYFYLVRNKLQTAADAAALAAAQSIGNQTTAVSVAQTVAQKNVPSDYKTVTTASDVVFGVYDSATKTFTASNSSVNAVKVTSARDQAHGNAPTQWLGNVLGAGEVSIAASAIAVGSTVGACVIALDATVKQSFSVNGMGTVNVPNCGIYVNSKDATALFQTGSGWIKSASISVVGDYAKAGQYSPTPKTFQPAIADPLAGIPEPTIPAACTYSNKKFTSPQTLAGGSVYCGNIELNSSVTFDTGIHYFKGATVKTASNVVISSTNAMLYFDDTTTWNSVGTGSVKLNSPTSGTYQGIAMFGSRKGKITTFQLKGGKDYFINGTIYLPTNRLELYGAVDVSADSKNGYVIAQQFYYQGNSSFYFDSFGGAVPSALALGKSALVY